MIEISYAIIMLGMCITGMLGAFFLGSRMNRERMFEFDDKPRMIQDSDVYEEPSESEYQERINTWDYFNESDKDQK